MVLGGHGPEVVVIGSLLLLLLIAVVVIRIAVTVWREPRPGGAPRVKRGQGSNPR